MNGKSRQVWSFLGILLALSVGILGAFFDFGSPTPLYNPRMQSVPVQPTSSFLFEQKVFMTVALIVLFAVALWTQRKQVIEAEAERAAEAAKQIELEKKVEAAPDKVKPVWELARFTLESYFQRNLSQVRQIFYVSVGAMVAGFLVVLLGIMIAIGDPVRFRVAVIASASGVLTQFISLTFMAIYRSTMAQANQYVSVLERINAVGMSVQVLDSMDKDDKESADLKNKTRVEIVTLLLTTPDGWQKTTVSHGRKSKAVS